MKKHLVSIKLFDKTLPLPQYKTEGSVGIDLYARVETKIATKSIGYIPLNIALQLPENTWAMLAARSSLHKKGLMLANGIGVGDRDFCGNDDEYMAAVFNFTDQEVVIEKAERVAQLIIMENKKVEFEEVSEFATKNRGGFGSTGKF